MDAFQQHHRYMRPPPPPPPSTMDPYPHHQQPLPQRPHGPSQGSWYSNQFQYHPSHSPSPPPPPQWAPPPPPHPHSDHLHPPGSYPPPQLPYPAHPPNQNQFPPPPPPPRPHLPPQFPPPPPHSQIPQAYPQHNQEWGTPNWAHQQGWDYPAHGNEEDWAAKARAWADAKTAMENQHSHPQFTPAGRLEEQSHYRDQYPQSMDSHYPEEIQHHSHAASSYQQVPVSAVHPHQPPVVHPLETLSVGSEPSYAPEGHLPHNVRVETSAADSNAMFHRGENLPSSSSVYQQEVPSSYSSVAGNGGIAEQSEQSHKFLPLPNSSYQEGQPHVQVLQHMPTSNLADQPLEFAPRYNHDHDPHMQSTYSYHDSVGPIRGIDPSTSVPSMNSWTAPVASGVAYPSMPPVLPSGPQHDSSLPMPSSVPGHAAPPFSSFSGPGLPSTIPPVGPPFALNAGAALHPSTAFSGDAYGISSISERPKKASVPNWLREEIKKAVITNSSLDHPKEEAQSIEDDIDKSIGKGEQADNKSIDSSRSTEEEDDDEDYVEAAKTAAINHEIKRVLTEVLLKVTDELFDEIATKVLDEDDLMVEGDQNTSTLNYKVLPTPPASLPPKATAKVLIPAKAKEFENEGISVKSSSSSPGDVLGLASYATDDDDDDDDDEDNDDDGIQSSRVPNSRKKPSLQNSTVEKPSEVGHHVVANDSSLLHFEGQSSNQTKVEIDPCRTSSIVSKHGDSGAITEFSNNRKRKVESNVGGNMLDGISRLKDTIGIVQSDLPEDNVNGKKVSKDDSHVKEMRKKLDKNDQHQAKDSSSGKKSHKDVESGKIRTNEKGDDTRRKQDERHPRKEKLDERNGSKERIKEPSSKTGVKLKESESKKRSSNLDVKEDRRETERHHKASAKEEINRKREHSKDKEEDRSRHKHASDSSTHKGRRSSSISSRGRSSKDNLVNHAIDSSDEASDDSKRKLHSRRHDLSPSPVKSRRRQVSRSPHSKHSQRRHSPYSSLDTNRGRRSRSRSPMWRHR